MKNIANIFCCNIHSVKTKLRIIVDGSEIGTNKLFEPGTEFFVNINDFVVKRHKIYVLGFFFILKL